MVPRDHTATTPAQSLYAEHDMEERGLPPVVGRDHAANQQSGDIVTCSYVHRPPVYSMMFAHTHVSLCSLFNSLYYIHIAC